jgi:hypothetical protein
MAMGFLALVLLLIGGKRDGFCKLIAALSPPPFFGPPSNRPLVDDLLSLNNPEFEALLPVIYPPAMLTVTQAVAGPSVDFLDMHIFQDTTTPSKPFVTSLYDKRRENEIRPLHLVRFPHIESLISDSARYGIVTSQFHRFRRIITSRPHFIREMASLLHELISKHYSPHRLLTITNGLLQKYPYLYATKPRTLMEQISAQLTIFNIRSANLHRQT